MKENKAQEEIINTVEGQLLVVACPGSGKTTTLVRRIDHMVNSGVDPNKIIMMTFSQAAAKEMETRYKGQFPENTPGVKFSTIHSFCFMILKTFFHYSSNCIISQKSVYDFFYKKLRYNKMVNDDLPNFIKSLLLDIGNIKNSMTELRDYKPNCTDEKELFVSLYNDYEEYKHRYNMIDFDDMLVITLEKLQSNPEIVKILQEQFQYIQVDEYQDTNVVQSSIIYLIAGKNGNLAVVGDDDQSIYGFRAATPKIMLDFKNEYPDAKIVKMSTNYRSREEIIDASNTIITNNKDRYDKEFIASRGKGGKVQVTCEEDLQSELNKIAKEIKKRHSMGEEYKNFSVLFRTNKQADGVANALIKENIPFVSTEPVKSRYEGWIYRDIMLFHELATSEITGPEIADDMFTLINRPNRFVPRSMTVKGMDYMFVTKQIAISKKEGWQKTKLREQIDEFFAGMNALKSKTPAEALSLIFYNLHYNAYLLDYARYHNEDEKDYMDTYHAFMEDVKDNNIKSWEDWDKFADRYNRIFQMYNKKKQDETEEDAVTISTMHKSKGLEWDVVYLPDSEETRIPGKNTAVDEIEEERRLFYVAMTRAREELYISYHGKGKATRFVKEMKTVPKATKGENDKLHSKLKNL